MKELERKKKSADAYLVEITKKLVSFIDILHVFVRVAVALSQAPGFSF